MPRRPVRRGSGPRQHHVAVVASPISSVQTTPASSTFTSTYTSEVEVEDEFSKLTIASLTHDVPLIPFNPKKRKARKPFPFLELPSELRVKIYGYFFDDIKEVLDLGPDNYKRIHKKLGLMRVCRQLHDEGTHFFYSTRTFRVFPTHPGRYFKSKKPLLARLKPVQRECITALELRLGPGWNAPPRGWAVNSGLGLAECINMHKLSVFVECDPSDSVFKGFRRAEGFYESFSRSLLAEVLGTMPAVDVVEFDAWPSVKKSGAMMHGLLEVVTRSKRLVGWGSERGWTDAMDEDDTVDEAVRFVQGVSIPGYVSNDVEVLA